MNWGSIRHRSAKNAQQDRKEVNEDDLNTVKSEASKQFRNKKENI
jgi:hypothetical protein